MLAGDDRSSRELLLGLRYYTMDGRSELRPERIPKGVCEIGAVSFLLTFMLFYTCVDDERMEWKLPSISYAAAFMPSSIPYGLGLHMCSFLLAITFWAVYTTQFKKLSWNSARRMPDEYCNAKIWARRCMVIGMIHCLFMAITGSLSINYSYQLHTVVSSLMFLFGALYATLFVGRVLSTAKKLFVMSNDDERDYRLKWWLALFVIILFIIHMGILVVVQVFEEVDCVWPDYCITRVARSSVEYLMALGLLFFYYTLHHDLHGVQLELMI